MAAVCNSKVQETVYCRKKYITKDFWEGWDIRLFLERFLLLRRSWRAPAACEHTGDMQCSHRCAYKHTRHVHTARLPVLKTKKESREWGSLAFGSESREPRPWRQRVVAAFKGFPGAMDQERACLGWAQAHLAQG